MLRDGQVGAWLGKKVLDVSRHVPLVALKSQQKEVGSTPGAATARSLPAVTKPSASLRTRSDRGQATSERNKKWTTGAIDFGKLLEKKTALLRYDLHVLLSIMARLGCLQGCVTTPMEQFLNSPSAPEAPVVCCSPSLLPGTAGCPASRFAVCAHAV